MLDNNIKEVHGVRSKIVRILMELFKEEGLSFAKKT
jgi:hypothetical protein